MVEIMRMPGVLAGAESGTLYTWAIAPGEEITEGQPIAEIETEKATVEITAETAGTVGRLLVAEGEEVDVGAPILAILAPGDSEADIDAMLGTVAEPAAAAEEPAPQAPAETSAPVEPSAPEPTPAAQPSETRLFASPLVRRLAREHSLDLTAIEGTGPGGRIVRRDVEKFLADVPRVQPEAPAAAPTPTTPAPSGATYTDIPLTPMRRAIARRLTESKSTVPHFYLTADCRVDELLALREQINAASTRRISVNDIILKAVAVAHTEVPEANAAWNTDSIRRFDDVDIALAVAIDDGLVTPVLRGVEKMSITTVSATAADLVERARAGSLKLHELEGGSFTVSNLGMYGTKEFSAILNPPQSGILAVGAARSAPVVTDDGELTVAKVMSVTLSADHRVLDGAVAATWLAAFQKAIENPMRILL